MSAVQAPNSEQVTEALSEGGADQFCFSAVKAWHFLKMLAAVGYGVYAVACSSLSPGMEMADAGGNRFRTLLAIAATSQKYGWNL